MYNPMFANSPPVPATPYHDVRRMNDDAFACVAVLTALRHEHYSHAQMHTRFCFAVISAVLFIGCGSNAKIEKAEQLPPAEDAKEIEQAHDRFAECWRQEFLAMEEIDLPELYRRWENDRVREPYVGAMMALHGKVRGITVEESIALLGIAIVMRNDEALAAYPCFDAKLTEREKADAQSLREKMLLERPYQTDQSLALKRDSTRRSDLSTILFSIRQFAIDNGGQLPFESTPENETEICKRSAPQCDGMVKMDERLFDPDTYLRDLPEDPLAPATKNGTRYFLKVSSSGEITLSAPDAEGEQAISKSL